MSKKQKVKYVRAAARQNARKNPRWNGSVCSRKNGKLNVGICARLIPIINNIYQTMRIYAMSFQAFRLKLAEVCVRVGDHSKVFNHWTLAACIARFCYVLLQSESLPCTSKLKIQWHLQALQRLDSLPGQACTGQYRISLGPRRPEPFLAQQ